jgi:hypothetical protein
MRLLCDKVGTSFSMSSGGTVVFCSVERPEDERWRVVIVRLSRARVTRQALK